MKKQTMGTCTPLITRIKEMYDNKWTLKRMQDTCNLTRAQLLDYLYALNLYKERRDRRFFSIISFPKLAEKIEKDYRRGKSIRWLSDHHGRSEVNIRNYLIERGLHQKRFLYEYNDKKIKAMLKKGIPIVTIAEQLNIYYTALYAYIRKKKLYTPFKLLPTDLPAIRDLIDAGIERATIAKKYNVTLPTLYNFLRRHNVNIKKKLGRPRARMNTYVDNK